MRRFIITGCLLASIILPAAAAPVPKDTTVSEKVIQAWEQRGAIVDLHVPLRNRNDWEANSKRSPQRILHIYFSEFDGSLKDLPAIGHPYTIEFSKCDSLPKNWLDDLPDAKNLIGLKYFNTDVNDEALKSLARLSSLEWLALSGSRFSNESVKHLSGLKALTDLSLSDVTNGIVFDFKELTGLERLKLSGERFTDEGVGHLKGLTKLGRLDLSNTGIKGVGMEHLNGLTELRSLDLSHSAMKNEGLVHIKGMDNLRSLDVDRTEVTDEGLEHLKGMTKLEFLNLSCVQITEAGLGHLKCLFSVGLT